MTLPPIDPQPAGCLFERPQLLVVVDTEEEFDWSAPLTRDRHGTTAASALKLVHTTLQKLLEHGVIEQYRRSFGPVKRALGLAS